MKFENPYSLRSSPDAIPEWLEKDGVVMVDKIKTTIFLPKKVVERLNVCRPHTGTIQTTVSILVEKLIQQLDENQLTTYDRPRYENAVAGATIRLGNDGSTVADSKKRRKATS